MYVDLLKNHLGPAIKSKRRRLLSTGVLLQHDNDRPHTAHSTVATIQDLSFECLPLLLYSPDLAPVTFMSLDHWKSDGRQVFQVRRKQAMHEWLCSQPKDFFSRGIHALLKCWNTCMVCTGDYVEKWSNCVPFVFNKLRDKKYLSFLFDSPTYITTLVRFLRKMGTIGSCEPFYLLSVLVRY